MASVQLTPQGLRVYTPYNPGFVAALKANIPTAGRTWDKATKAWIIAPNYAISLAALMKQYYPGTSVPIPSNAQTPRAEARLLEVRYVGATKDRGDDARSAFGYASGAWSVIFPEPELRRWFGLDTSNDAPSASASLYQVLNVTRTATPDEIKSAWRRMARQWHPDVCKEPDATQQFRRIQEAYEALSDPRARARYDAGLLMAAAVMPQARDSVSLAGGYRPPLRCGHVLAEGHEQLSRFVVSKILAWEDITNAQGQTLVTSWPTGAQHFTEAWV